MKLINLILCLILGLFPLGGCTEADNTQTSSTESATASSPTAVSVETNTGETVESSAPTLHQVIFRASGDVLSIENDKSDTTAASYFSTKNADPGVLFLNIIWILETTKADKKFVDMFKQRLAENRRFKKANFSFPVTDEEDITHTFEYRSNFEQDFYTLNYTRK